MQSYPISFCIILSLVLTNKLFHPSISCLSTSLCIPQVWYIQHEHLYWLLLSLVLLSLLLLLLLLLFILCLFVINKSSSGTPEVCTLNLSQEMSDKMQNESGQFNHAKLRKCQKLGQNWPSFMCFWHFGCLLWTELAYWPDSFKILSGIFLDKFLPPWKIVTNLCFNEVSEKSLSRNCHTMCLNISQLSLTILQPMLRY